MRRSVFNASSDGRGRHNVMLHYVPEFHTNANQSYPTLSFLVLQTSALRVKTAGIGK